jgi:tRNA dimethylallyltransferase
VVVADSRQVYRGLDIATNKPDPEWRRRVPYHMIDLVPASARFNAAQWVRGASRAIEDIAGRGRLPVVEGGTLLYVDALADGFTLAGVPPDAELRRRLVALTTEQLAARVRQLDPDAQMDFRNPVRLVRAIEVLEAVGPPLARLRQRQPPEWEAIRIGLIASREVIDRRLAERSDRQLERGLLDETKRALESGVPADAPVLTGIGYAEAVAHLRGEIQGTDLAEAIARANRRFARRQLTWLRRDQRINWFQAEPDPLPAILSFLKERLS